MALLGAGCGGAAPAAPQPTAMISTVPVETAVPAAPTEPPRPTALPASVVFASPADGATVPAPFEVCLDTARVEVVAAGDTRPGTGHHHLIVDPMGQEFDRLAAAGAPAIPEIDRYVHWDDGAACGQLDLKPGPHVLLAVMGDGEHHPLSPPVMARIRVTVEDAPP